MQKTHNIQILSRPVRTGKTSELQEFIKLHNSVAGFLTPDVDGKRMLYDIAEDIFYSFETDENEQSPVLKVGRFCFLQEAFDKGQDILKSALHKEWIIIDEVGKLEVEQNIGFEPAVTELIGYCKRNVEIKLILVIRDSLLQKAIEKYSLQEAELIHHL